MLPVKRGINDKKKKKRKRFMVTRYGVRINKNGLQVKKERELKKGVVRRKGVVTSRNEERNKEKSGQSGVRLLFVYLYCIGVVIVLVVVGWGIAELG